MKIRVKYPLVVVALVVIAIIATGFIARTLLVEDKQLTTERNLVSILAARRDIFTSYLNELMNDLLIYREGMVGPTVINEFSQAWREIEGDPTATLQNLYIEENPFPTGEKELLDSANDGSTYSAVHAKYHPLFRTLYEKKGYYDIFLFDKDGNLIYTVFKESDFATNILTGPWNTSGLSEVYRAAIQKSPSDAPAFIDFQPYEPSGFAPASFLATPIFGAEDKLLGVLALQMPIDRMNGFMHVTEGLGETGETYLVGQDLLMRSDSRFSEESTILKTKVDTVMARNALQGESGLMTGLDYRGVSVLSAYAPVSFLGVQWAMLAEMDETEFLEPANQLTERLTEGGILMIIIATALSYLAASHLTRPIVKLNKIMVRLAEGDVDAKVPQSDRSDEIADMQQALAIFKENEIIRLREADRLKIALRDLTLQRQTEIEIRELNDGLEQEVGSAQEKLKQEKSMLSSLINCLPDIVFYKDANGVYLGCNKSFAELNDLNLGDCVGKDDYALYPKDEADSYVNFDKQMLETGKTCSMEGEVTYPDGRTVLVDTIKTPFSDDEGNIIGIIGVSRDITERKTQEETTKKALEALSFTQYAVDHTGDMALWITLEDARIFYVNEAMINRCGYTKDELLQMSVTDFDPDFPEQEWPNLVEKLKSGEPLTFPSRNQSKSGEIYPVEVTARYVKYGEKENIIAFLRDTTERKEMEAQLRESAEIAEAAAMAKASFLAAMSHEIRTPMNGVVGMIELLRESKLDDDQIQMVDTVKSSAYSLLTIINDILDFSKIEAGKLDLEEIPISIANVVEGVGEALAVTARNKNIQLCVYVDPGIPDAIVGDQVRLRQIIFNLGGNAIKFTEKGKVLIRADRMPSDDDKYITIRLKVSDDGIGIPKSAQKSLFQAFSQVDASTTRRFGGTGLGLSICQRLTELMGGEIGVKSVEGEGSTFHVTVILPIAEDHNLRSDGEDLNGLRVLLVLGDTELRDLTPRYLKNWGARTETVEEMATVKDAVLAAISKGDPFDVVVIGSDWELEDQITLIKDLTAEKTVSAKFVVACRQRSRKHRKDLGNTVYLDADPMQRGALIRAVAVAMGRASPEIDYDDSEIAKNPGKAPTIEEAAELGQLILLAEDNLTNQNVIKRQLTMLGYAVEIANDGVEALELMKKRSYAILLSDCHMPNMDGFDLTKTLRQSEASTSDHLPIIAVTASVMKEEIDNCYASGMDDYLMKPLEMDKLRAKLRKWMPKSHEDTTLETQPAVTTERDGISKEEDQTQPQTNIQPEKKVVDPKFLRESFGDDPDLISEILNEYIEPAQESVTIILKAFEDQNHEIIGEEGHKLKSSSLSIGANEFSTLCDNLEEAGHKGDWEALTKIKGKLETQFKAVVEDIKKF